LERQVFRLWCWAAKDARAALMIVYCGSSSPNCSRTIYSAYQSGQFARIALSVSRAAHGLRSAHRLCKIVRRGIDAYVVLPATRPASRFVTSCSNQPLPSGSLKENKRIVAEMLGVRPGHSRADAGKPASRSGLTVKHLARIDAVCDEFAARRLDVGDGEEHCLCRTRCSRCEVYAELDRAAGAGRPELDQAEVVTGGAVGIQPPPGALSRTFLRCRRRKRG
jgi:hypothetical protein